MKINKITYEHRRDFQAIYECEGCAVAQAKRTALVALRRWAASEREGKE